MDNVPGLSDRISLRALLGAFAAIGLVLVLAAAAIVTFSVAQVSRETDRVTDIYEPAATNVYTLNLATSDMERGISLYALGGYEADLRPYVDGERRSAIALASLERLLGGDQQISPLIRAVESSREEWLAQVARPALSAMREGQRQKAREIIVGNESLVLFDRFVTDSDRLRNTIDSERSTSFDRLTELTNRLTWFVAVGMVTLLGAVLLAWYLMFRWVLAPLESLRAQMQEVARDRKIEARIVPEGPSEIKAVGRDAEEMRRQLVTEIDTALHATDTARRATQSLASDAPVVTAIMRELGTQTDHDPVGVEVAGEIHAAETVLAGDFWDCIALPSDRTAVVIADVAGHGDAVGVAATRIKHLLAVALASGRSPGSALALAARRLSDENEPIATAAVAVLDPSDGALAWANAGHHPPLLIRASGEVVELAPTGPLLSWLGGPWQIRNVHVSPGDVVLLYSDGLVESHDADGEQLGVAGLLQLATQVRKADPGGAPLVRRLLALARERAIDWERDDVTLVALSLAGAAPLQSGSGA